MSNLAKTLTSLAVVALVTTAGAQTQIASSVDTSTRQLNNSMRSLWRVYIDVPQPASDASGADELEKAVSKAGKFKVPKAIKPAAATQPATVVEDSAKSKALSTEAKQATMTPTSQPVETKATRKVARIAPATLAKLKVKASQGTANLIPLADALFGDGRTDQAADLYEHIFKVSTDESQKAWALYQTANCRWKSAPSAAADAYTKLIAEYPQSVWGTPARAQLDFVKFIGRKNLTELTRISKKLDTD